MIEGADISYTLKKLRDEASEVKRCYTDFAIKVLILATAFFGFIFKFYPIVGETDSLILYFLEWLLCASVISVLMCISRIGYHKYSTANRNYGYELHINRSYDYEKWYGKKLESKIRKVGWEEAMCAWRIVQPIIFEKIYRVWRLIHFLLPLPVVERHFESEEYHWWNTKYLMNSNENGKPHKGNNSLPYHPGRFLRNTQVLIHTICAAIYVIFTISYISVFFSVCEFALSKIGGLPRIAVLLIHIYIGLCFFLLWFYLTLYFVLTVIRHHSRRRILENGLLSIQSCAVVWRLVVIAHLKALEEGFSSNNDYQGYTKRLAQNACLIRSNLFTIHKNIMKGDWPQPSEIIQK